MEDTRCPERQLVSSKGDKIYKTKEEMKELGMETCPGEGVLKEEKFPHSRKPSHRRVCGDFWNLRRQHTRRENRRKKKKKTHRIRI